jgi:hypothetical protein
MTHGREEKNNIGTRNTITNAKDYQSISLTMCATPQRGLHHHQTVANQPCHDKKGSPPPPPPTADLQRTCKLTSRCAAFAMPTKRMISSQVISKSSSGNHTLSHWNHGTNFKYLHTTHNNHQSHCRHAINAILESNRAPSTQRYNPAIHIRHVQARSTRVGSAARLSLSQT